MAATASPTSSVPAVPAVTGISKSKDTSLTVNLGSVDQGDVNPSSAYITYGKATARPTTFADFVNPVTDLMAAGDAANFRYRGGSSPLWDGSYTTLSARANSAWTVGDSVYVALFATASPSSGDVPIALGGPILVIA
jgi:hypothetical protein